MKGCLHSNEYLAEERRQLRWLIAAARRRQSSRLGHDVGAKAAESDVDNRIEYFARSFHDEFCGHVCQDRGTCRIYRRHMRACRLGGGALSLP